MSVEISGRCDGCGREARRDTISEFCGVPVMVGGEFKEYDFCRECIHELASIDDALPGQIAELRRRHGAR